MKIPADVEADVISLLPQDIGAMLAVACERFSTERTPWVAQPSTTVPLAGWPDVDPARAWVSCEATCLSLARMLTDWRFSSPAEDSPLYQEASVAIEQAVRRHILSRTDELQLRVLDGIEPLKGVALAQTGPGAGTRDAVLGKRSQVWLDCARGYVDDGRDLRNAVVYTALVLHLEFVQAPPEFSELIAFTEVSSSPGDAVAGGIAEASERRQLLALAAAGGGHVPAYQREWIRRAVQDNVASA